MGNAILLLLCTMIWGFGFIGTKWTLTDYTPMWSNSFRFIIAGGISLPILLYKRSFAKPMKDLLILFAVAAIMFTAMLLQTYGLKYTTVAKSGFITSLYAFFIPLVSVFFLKRRLSPMFWILTSVALIGVAMMCNLEWSQFNFGDFLTVLCALFFALQVLAIEFCVRRFPSAIEVNCFQCLFMGILGTVLALVSEGMFDFTPLLNQTDIFGPGPIMGFVMVGIFSSLIGFGIQAYTQKTISAHIVGLILLMESPFAAVFGFFVLGEKLSQMNIVGAILVVFAVAFIPLTESKRVAAYLQKKFQKRRVGV